ncbi:hypothetical protein BT67DRAFT_389196 [Trichocladium antarcticum]|uniref:Uncharacterized protein n=1 Tax=Trichocladium antarcticum TaxID=1450529 RepID=A0AAN6UE15_9PEZI|nr:hypothetical protein BT67DRAFT_389196 [Trichocladium antarcticum]
MGILNNLFPASESDKRATEVRTGAVAPTRAERKQCWVARDAYFACLDAHNIMDALQDERAAAKACGAESAGFEKDCATQWKRARLKELEAQGANKLDVATDFAPRS